MTTLYNRVIPSLLLEQGGLVKTVGFRNPKYVGDPINAVRIFNEKYVDELIVLDIGASRAQREPDYELIGRIAGECFMPFCYGGGIRTLDQARRIVALGVEKVAVNAAALNDITLIQTLADELGTQSVVGALDVRRDWFGRPWVYDSAARRKTRIAPLAHAQALVKAGAGELLLNDSDRDGRECGYDLELLKQITHAVNVPVIASGGAGRLVHFAEALGAGASAVAAGSMFVFYGPHRAVLINYPDYATLRRSLPQ